MSLFRRLFRKPASTPSQESQASSSPNDAELITVYDKYGRQMQIPKSEWRDKVLGPNLKQAWDQPDQLYSFILSAFRDKLFAEVEDAAKRLAATDPHPDRGATTLAIVYQQTDRHALAEEILLAHTQAHGEDGVVLTNLAKSQDALGRHDEAMQTLWRALELDPNQDIALLWYEVVEREKRGKDAGLAAFKRVAALPCSWRAQLWVARAALEAGELDEAIALYEESLAAAGDPPPTDALQQITGDLGRQGHLVEAITLVSSRYDFERHGIEVGNNLIKTYFDLGQLDHARSLLTQLQSLQRPDYQEHLAHWEDVIAKADFETRDAPDPASVQIQAIPVPGPLWLKQDHPISSLFPPKQPDAPLVAFTGCSLDHPNNPIKASAGLSNSSGRFTRALPLFLAERIHLETTLQSRALIPMAVNQGGGLVVTTGQTTPNTVASLARMPAGSAIPADYAVDSHLLVEDENWTLQLRLIRTIDADTLAHFEYNLPENGFHHIAPQVLEDIYSALNSEADLDAQPTAPPNSEVKDTEIDHYLLRLEQSLAARCAVNLPESENFLQNPTEIINGTLFLCIQNPEHLPSRFILWRTLDAIKQLQPDLACSFAPKIKALQTDHPIDHPAYPDLTDEFENLLSSQ